MTRYRRQSLFVGLPILLAALASPVEAQLPTGVLSAPLEGGPILLELPMSVRAAGMGDAFGGWTEGSHAVFFAPGLLGEGFAASLYRYSEASSLVAVSAGTEWFGGSVAVGVSALEHGVSDSEPSALLRDPASLQYLGPIASASTTVNLGYARELFGLQLGAVGSYISQRLGVHRASTVAVDLGANADLGFGSLSFSALNLGPGLDIGTETLDLPKRFLLSLGTNRLPVGPFDLRGAGQVSRDGGGAFTAGAGMELAYWPIQGRTFIARLGARTSGDTTVSPLTFGLGFTGDQIGLDYAFGGFDSVDGVHRFSVSFN